MKPPDWHVPPRRVGFTKSDAVILAIAASLIVTAIIGSILTGG